MAETEIRPLTVQIIDFNPIRMGDEEIGQRGIPVELRKLVGDKRQYPLHIARHLPGDTLWFNTSSPWYFRTVMADNHLFAQAKEKDVLILSGSGMSSFQFQEKELGVFSALDRRFLERSQTLVRDYISAGKWVLGICFGGQLAVHAVKGKIGRLPQNEAGYTVTEAGWLPHELTKEGINDEVFRHLPDQFFASHLHSDFVTELPEPATPFNFGRNHLMVARSEVLAIRRGYLGTNGIQSAGETYIHASLIEFNNGARLYQIQPHPEMASADKANFLVRQNPWIAKEMGQGYYNQALVVPENADFSVAQIVTNFVTAARKHYERYNGASFTLKNHNNCLNQLSRYLID